MLNGDGVIIVVMWGAVGGGDVDRGYECYAGDDVVVLYWVDGARMGSAIFYWIFVDFLGCLDAGFVWNLVLFGWERLCGGGSRLGLFVGYFRGWGCLLVGGAAARGRPGRGRAPRCW